MAEKLLSVVIPTKDREYYCQRVLDYMLTFDDDRIEFVIQNNGSSDKLDEYIKKKNDSRIVYNHVYEPLCQVDNSDQSIALSTGKYLCFIGDDDIVLPNIMHYVEYAIENKIDSIAQKTPIPYFWPSETIPAGKLYFTPPTGLQEFVNDQQACINAFIRNGCCENPKDYKLPILYHGITRRQCIEEVKNETGHYVGGSSPDSYTSVSLAKFVKKQLIIDSNFSIFGACPQSATALNLVGGHCGRLEDAPHLKNRGVYEWDHLVPKYYSVQTIWAESAITALRETNNPNADRINLKKLFCMSYIHNKTIRDLIVQQTNICLSENGRNKVLFWITSVPMLLDQFAMNLFNRVIGRIKRDLKINKVQAIENVKDISECVKYIC